MKKFVRPSELDSAAMVKIFKSVAHAERIAILSLLDFHKELNVTYIYQRLTIEQAVVSRHLSFLKSANVVKIRREGKMIFYSLNGKPVATMLQSMLRFVK